MFWAKKFRASVRSETHIVPGNKKDNFWMMGETGPCGPAPKSTWTCTPDGNTRLLVNKATPAASRSGTTSSSSSTRTGRHVSPLPAKHVDTGMGFERVTSIIQGTKGLTDFSDAKISNYETDIFRPIFDAIENSAANATARRSRRPGSTGDTEQEKADVAFRVIADHIRTLWSFAIADGISPATPTATTSSAASCVARCAWLSLGFHEPFFYKLVDVRADHDGRHLPEIRAKQHVQDVIKLEEESFNKTLDHGISFGNLRKRKKGMEKQSASNPNASSFGWWLRRIRWELISCPEHLPFKLYDTLWISLDLTELWLGRGLKWTRKVSRN